MTNITNITGKYDQPFLKETADKQQVDPSANPTDTEKTERIQDDKVSLSSASKEMQTAKDAVSSTPDIRQNKVNEIKQAVENGTYQVNAGQVADKMIGSNVNEVV